MSQQPFTPVPVHARHDGWTPERQWHFVEALSRTASITQAVQAVGMSARSAQRLRRHPEAGEFRAAWDKALRQVWGELERVALDRALNGETEVIERDGYVLATKRRPCSDKLLIHLLNSRERALTAERAERVREHKRALAEAEKAAFAARVQAAKRGGKAAPAPTPEVPPLPSDADAETAALAAFHAHAETFTLFPVMDPPHDLKVIEGDRAVREAHAAWEAAGCLPAIHTPQAQTYETRLRWEDFRDAADSDASDASDSAVSDSAAGEVRDSDQDATFGTF